MTDWLQRFVDDGEITQAQLRDAQDLADTLKIPTELMLWRMGYIAQRKIGQAQAEEFNFEFVELDEMIIPQSIIRLISEFIARLHLVIAIDADRKRVVVAVHNPNFAEVQNELRAVLKREIQFVIAPLDSIQDAIKRHYGPTKAEEAAEAESPDTLPEN